MFQFFLDGVLLPVAPSKLSLSYPNQNKSINLINGEQVNLINSVGLTCVSFEALLPQFVYPFASSSNFKDASYYLDFLLSLKENKKVFQFIVIRDYGNSNSFHSTNIKVSLESFSVVEDASSLGADVLVSISLKQFVDVSSTFSVVLPTNSLDSNTVTVSSNSVRETSSVSDDFPKSYTVVKGDCLWDIAKTFYGDGAKYPAIYNANKSLIDGDNVGTGNPLYTIYPSQLFTIPAL